MLIYNIGTLATPVGNAARGGEKQGDILFLHNAYVRVENGLITDVGEGTPKDKDAEFFDAGGRLATPGLVDAHTHLVFGGWREQELALKLRGVPYLDILKAGGGILSTVRETRRATEEQLADKAEDALREMLCLGTTTCEAKSGYGLNEKDELKQLRALKTLMARQWVDLVPTLMAAHAVPEEYKADRANYIRLIKETIIPATAREGLAEFCDVFCETGVFSGEESADILSAARENGLRCKIHIDEIDDIGGTQVARDSRAVSAEHLIAASDEGIRRLKEGGVIACLLPATSFYLDKPFARARDMISSGVPVAVASDFNPGSCPSFNLQFCMNLASWKYKMRPEEVLTAVTLNAAAAVGRADSAGTLEKGKKGDLVLWKTDNLPYLMYRFGENLADTVFKNGVAAARGGKAFPQ